MKDATLLFLERKEELLLAMKKRGFGEGKWNGVGGKVEAGETPEEGAVREANEEIGVTIDPHSLTKVAEIKFRFDGKPEENILCHVYTAFKWEGEPVETEEMRPQWFTKETIPFDTMWAADRHWLSKMLLGEKRKWEITFTEDGSTALDIKSEPF